MSRVLWKLNLTNWPGEQRSEETRQGPDNDSHSLSYRENVCVDWYIMITVVHWVLSENWIRIYESDTGRCSPDPRRLAIKARYGSYVSVEVTTRWSAAPDKPSVLMCRHVMTTGTNPVYCLGIEDLRGVSFWKSHFNIFVHVSIINVAHWRCDTLPHVLTPRSPGVNNKWHTYLASYWSTAHTAASDWSKLRTGLRITTGPNGVPRHGPDFVPARLEKEKNLG